MRFDIAGPVKVVAAHARDHVILYDHGSHRTVVKLVQVADRLSPPLLAVLQVQGNQVAVRGFEIEPVAVYANPAVADVDTALRLPGVMPDFAPRARVYGPHVVGKSEVEQAVDLDRRALDAAGAEAGVRPVDPGQAQRIDVGGIDLLERAVAASRVVAVVCRPTVSRRRLQFRRVEPALSEERGRQQ